MHEPNVPQYRPVYRTLHRPLTVCGVDRRLFFLALLVGAASFNLFYSFSAGVAIFSVIYAVGFWTTSRDPQLLQILLRSAGLRLRYDAARRDTRSLICHRIRSSSAGSARSRSKVVSALMLRLRSSASTWRTSSPRAR